MGLGNARRAELEAGDGCPRPRAHQQPSVSKASAPAAETELELARNGLGLLGSEREFGIVSQVI